MELATRHNEPRDIEIKLKSVQAGDEVLVFGKAAAALEDSLLKVCPYERKRCVFGNYLTLAEQVGNRITVNLARHMPGPDLFALRICVKEMLIDAIEHGNLAITFDENPLISSNTTAWAMKSIC